MGGCVCVCGWVRCCECVNAYVHMSAHVHIHTRVCYCIGVCVFMRVHLHVSLLTMCVLQCAM